MTNVGKKIIPWCEESEKGIEADKLKGLFGVWGTVDLAPFKTYNFYPYLSLETVSTALTLTHITCMIDYPTI